MADESAPVAENEVICGERHFQGVTCIRPPHEDGAHRNGVAEWVSSPPVSDGSFVASDYDDAEVRDV